MEEHGLFWIFYTYGIKTELLPPIIFLGVGVMTDFGPLISNPKMILLGGAAQFGVYIAFFTAIFLGFTMQEAASIGIIGGADGPTTIYLTQNLAPHLLGANAVAAYSYMAMVPLIQPPLMRLFTSKEERIIRMKQPKPVPQLLKIIFPIIVALVGSLLVPPSAPLLAMLMLGNLFRESGVVQRLSKTAENELINITTIFLGVAVGATMSAERFLTLDSIKIFILGLVAFAFSTVGGIFVAKFMNLFLAKDKKINPLIGAAGVSAVPMAARVAQKVGQEENKQNYLLMHAMGPNVAGVIGTLVAAGMFLSLLG
jgi:oxaloacetate decarboxylase beta subunit